MVRAVLVPEPGKLVLAEKAVPIIRESTEVLVRVKAGGICGTDLHIFHGTSPVATYPRVIGHEFVGEVVARGRGVTRVREGDHVVVEPIFFCGKCYPCSIGRPNVCENLEVMGVHRDGGFQEYVVVPERNVYPFSKDISWEEAVLMEPFTIALQVADRGNIASSDTVFIIGAGPIGLCILAYLKYLGAQCGISDIIPKRLERAKNLGADFVVHSGEENLEREVLRHFPGGAHVVIDASGLPETFAQAVQLASRAGRVVVLGFHTAPSPIPQASITLRELTIVGSRLQAHKFPQVVALFEERKLQPGKLVSHVFSFERVHEAFALLEHYPEETCKVLLSF
ncbi:MAG: zinc-binding alcohol dehydrogenase family protein [Atribacterota bacterium]